MESYSDRIDKFNDMVNSTNDHIRAVQEAATKYKDISDPIGLGLEVTGAGAGGISTIAGGIAGMQHFKDFRQMYKGISSKLSGARSRINTELSNAQRDAGLGRDGQAVNNRGAAVADQDGNANPQPDVEAPAQATAPAPTQADVDGGLADRISDLPNQPFPTQEANDINSAIIQKVQNNLGPGGKQLLNDAARSAGRGGEANTVNQLPEGSIKIQGQQDLLNFKNKIANDAISRAQTGRTQASGYDADGNATGDLPGPQPSGGNGAVQTVPDQAPNPVAPQNGVNLASDANQPNVLANAAGDNVSNVVGDAQEAANGIIAQGRAALANLIPGQVPSRAGGIVAGMRIGAGNADDVAAQANAGARVQQAAADDAANRLAPSRNPNGQAPAANGEGAGIDGNAGGGNAGAAIADGNDINDAINGARAAAGGAASDIAESVAGTVGAGLDEAAAFAGPAAPIVGLIGGLVSLGTTIAGLFHHKPAPQKEAPPPPSTVSVGGNLKDSVSGMGAGIF